MDEVSSYVRLNLPSLTARPLNRLFPSSSNPIMEGPWCRVRREARARERHTARGQGIGLGEVLKHIAEKEPALAPFRIVVKKQGRVPAARSDHRCAGAARWANDCSSMGGHEATRKNRRGYRTVALTKPRLMVLYAAIVRITIIYALMTPAL
jgi:hypothetical protein